VREAERVVEVVLTECLRVYRHDILVLAGAFIVHTVVVRSHAVYTFIHITAGVKALNNAKNSLIINQSSLKFKTSQLWNKLPHQLMQIRFLNSFKLQLKIIYLIKYAKK